MLRLCAAVALLCCLVYADNTCTRAGVTDGCNTPFNLPAPYKAEFMDDCHRHDICYACGAMFKFTRDDCDARFRNDLLRRCTLVEDVNDVFKINACRTAANGWFAGVKTAGVFGFKSESDTPAWCKDSWVKLCV